MTIQDYISANRARFMEEWASLIRIPSISCEAVYKADDPTSAPEVVTNPSNPAQKLIRNGNVYILTDSKTYTVTGQEVR